MPLPLSSYTPTDHIIVLLSAEYNKGVSPHRVCKNIFSGTAILLKKKSLYVML